MASNNSRSVNAHKGSELLSWLATVVDQEKDKSDSTLGERIAVRVALEWGGQSIYFPMDSSRRNKEIFAQFSGQNYHDLARKFHLSEGHIRNIINAETARRKLRQNLLPGLIGKEE